VPLVFVAISSENEPSVIFQASSSRKDLICDDRIAELAQPGTW